MRRILLALATVVGVVTALPAAAQFQKPEDAVKYRKAAFWVMGQHFGRIGAMVQGRVPFDGAVAAANAGSSPTCPSCRSPASSRAPPAPRRARPRPTSGPTRPSSTAGAKKMQEEVAKLATAAKANNLDTLKAAFGNAAGTCKACHDDYRN
jgi:cytochrome c556